MNLPDNFFCQLIRGNGLSVGETEHISEVYEEFGREGITGLIKNRKITPFAARTFTELGIDKEYWSGIMEEYCERNRKILTYLNKAYEALEAHGVRKIFVTENFGALLSADGDISLFASGDVDNCADISEKEKIYAAFESLGFKRRERFAVNNQIAATFHPKDSEIGDDFYISVDFHPLARLKLPCFVNADDFIDWNKLYRYRDTSIKLPPADALLYICLLHISLHSFSRAPGIRLYTDLLNMSKLDIDFNIIKEWAVRDNTQNRISVSSYISNQLMKTAYPADLTDIGKKRDKILKIVYDRHKNDLTGEPGGLKVLLIELLCNEKGIGHGIHELLMPDKEWVKSTYGSTGIFAYMRHFFRII